MNAPSEPRRLSDLTPQQRKSGFAAWLGWMFDGLDMHIYTLVAAAFVSMLVFSEQLTADFGKLDADQSGLLSAAEWPALSSDAFQTADHNRDGAISRDEFDVQQSRDLAGHASVKEKASWIQAAFLIGWAFGGAFFGRLGDILGRSRALSLTVLTYALFTGLSFFAQTWWQLMAFRFLAALGIGGEWAVGSTLLAETWPKRWRPWTAAVLQTGVNIGIIAACVAGFLLGGSHPKWIFLVGVLPAVLVFYIRRHVPEPATWAAAHAMAPKPSVFDLFKGKTRRVTLVSIGICAFSLTAWWAFMFWQAQHVRILPEARAMTPQARDELVTITFALIVGVSIVGNFVSAWLAQRLGYKSAIVLMFGGFIATMTGAFGMDHSLLALTRFWLPAVGFWSGVFGLFTMLLPPLFPTLLRTTGAGFSYNIGRVAAAAGTIFAANLTPGQNYRQTLFYVGFLYVPAILFTLMLPDPDETETV